jgi:hypothetical protein
MSPVNSVELPLVKIILVLSANKTSLDTLDSVFGKSFMFRKRNKGPRINTWGTPCLTNPTQKK